MNHVEEQKNELEALSAIYYNEIKVRSNKPPISFSIEIRPQASNYEGPTDLADGADEDEDDDSDADDDDDCCDTQAQCPKLELLFQLPPKYPETKPSIQILNSQHLAEDELAQLLKNLNQKSEESLGSVMIFTLVSDIVEWLSLKAEREANEIEEQKTRRLEALEEEEKKKCDGMPVTVESFMVWKAKFDAELLKAKIEQQKKLAEQNPTSQKRLTGREMFETDKALAESDLNFVDDLDQDQLEALMQNIDEIELEEDEEDDDDDFDDEDEEYELGSDDEDELSEDELSEADCDDAAAKSKTKTKTKK